ncbi:hypothetical protein L1987_14498 [Smallanthus sonchifolius]|uniref:Uncharacterized protein n=1 Tax=Smallanthus sonchifolius TaxID=185202 RepID=A0ACB9J3E1_9ASTR|nr:hypothetical protein L1987_14498 [Smallanthus sonchifolius]
MMMNQHCFENLFLNSLPSYLTDRPRFFSMSSPAQTNHPFLHFWPSNLFNFPSNHKSESVIPRRLQLPAHHTDCRHRCHLLHSHVRFRPLLLLLY